MSLALVLCGAPCPSTGTYVLGIVHADPAPPLRRPVHQQTQIHGTSNDDELIEAPLATGGNIYRVWQGRPSQPHHGPKPVRSGSWMRGRDCGPACWSQQLCCHSVSDVLDDPGTVRVRTCEHMAILDGCCVLLPSSCLASPEESRRPRRHPVSATRLASF